MGTMKQLFCASFIGLVTSATPIWANSCSNISTMGTYDTSGVEEYGSGIVAVGTFRIEEEKDESKQPDFNLVRIDCNSVPGSNSEIFVCTMSQASVRANSEQPNADKQNCTLDLDIIEYQLKETSPGVLSGSASSGICYDSYLIINRNSKRVYLNFTKTKDAYKDDAKKLGLCQSTPRTEVLMNCTPWAALRKNIQTTSRYCDFSSAGDKSNR
jgi:hypothetical protein